MSEPSIQRVPRNESETTLEKIFERTRARKEKRFSDADRIRDELREIGIVLEDLPNGETRWSGLREVTQYSDLPLINIGCRCSNCYPPSEQMRLARIEQEMRNIRIENPEWFK